jgi:hypothetical protein
MFDKEKLARWFGTIKPVIEKTQNGFDFYWGYLWKDTIYIDKKQIVKYKDPKDYKVVWVNKGD